MFLCCVEESLSFYCDVSGSTSSNFLFENDVECRHVCQNWSTRYGVISVVFFIPEKNAVLLQGGPLPVINGVINPINGPYNWVDLVITPISGVITLLITGVWAHLVHKAGILTSPCLYKCTNSDPMWPSIPLIWSV